ncbi:hypothetical protein [Idiomarina sp.]|uniref:helix-turn-helix domain-containing protein n=1 Tax=Idiomarina sp. TaxID=1874361 RepID=UPI0025C08408|nr:hypothetical protein [Idiomarina sp.]
MANLSTVKHEQIEEILQQYRVHQERELNSLREQLAGQLQDTEVAGELEDFGNLVDAYKKEHKVTNEELALLSGKSKNAISKACQRPGSAGVATITSILDAMGYRLVIARGNPKPIAEQD